jgi:hypothetical protein
MSDLTSRAVSVANASLLVAGKRMFANLCESFDCARGASVALEAFG